MLLIKIIIIIMTNGLKKSVLWLSGKAYQSPPVAVAARNKLRLILSPSENSLGSAYK